MHQMGNSSAIALIKLHILARDIAMCQSRRERHKSAVNIGTTSTLPWVTDVLGTGETLELGDALCHEVKYNRSLS